MRYLIVGTAGHVDHGKTSLIRALNGFEGDTLKEEQKRGITIDLSFSSLQNDKINIAFVDVPGHKKLVKNMIAGAFGFDACMMMIDSKEGVMPQTKEHFEILNLLKVPYILIALTKSDLIDEELLKRRISEIREYCQNYSNLNLVNIIPVSIYNNNSINLFREELFTLNSVEKKSNGLFRYYVDRNFSISGIGSVVTGTILDGEVKVGDKLFVSQENIEVKVKNIQVHEKDVESGYVSQRVALNFQTSKVNFSRGVLLTKKGYIRGFKSVDVWIEPISGNKIYHNSTLIIYLGTMQLEVKVLLFDEISNVGGFARFEFKEKVYLVYNEPFILSISGRIIAGGNVLNSISEPMKKKGKLALLEALRDENFKRVFEVLVSFHKRGFGLISSNQRFGLSHNRALEIAEDIEDIFVDKKALILYPKDTEDILKSIIEAIYIKNRYAMLSAKSLSLKLPWASEAFLNKVLGSLIDKGKLLLKNGVYLDVSVDIKDVQSVLKEKIYNRLLEEGISPTAPYNIYDDLDIDRKLGDSILKNLTSAKKVKRMEHNLFVTYNSLTKLMVDIQEIIKKEDYIDIKLLKLYYPNLTRKYLISYLDYLDSYPNIKKEGLKRVFV